MSYSDRLPSPLARLRAAPTFSLGYSLDGRPFVSQEVEPYAQFWLSEQDRVLWSLFGAPRGETEEGALDGYLRLTGLADTPRRRAALRRTVAQMRQAGLVADPSADTSRYDAGMAADYLRHRPFPRDLSDLIVRDGAIGRTSRVLDLAGGPGSLALALAEASDEVTLMELSRGFVAAARAEARRTGRRLTTLHESCNRLAGLDGDYDVITVSQALHWLDDVAVCRGVTRLLGEGGTFFVVTAALELADDHPLSFVLGDRTPLGDKADLPFRDQALALSRRLGLLFEALDAPDVQRIDPTQRWTGQATRIAPAGVSFFRQRRPFGPGFARAFLSPAHVAMTGQTPAAFWADVERRCAAASPDQALGFQDWAVLRFRRGGPAPGCAPSPEDAVPICGLDLPLD